MKQPKITWRKGGDDKIRFIVKIIAYKRDYGMVMAVTKTNDEIQPNDFTFFFPYDTDENKGTLMTFYKKNWPIKTIGTEKLGTLAEEEIGVTFDNHLTFSNTGETVNLMKLCLQSDAILFKYTSKDGEPKSMRFPLAGLAEHYLEQFVYRAPQISFSFCSHSRIKGVKCDIIRGWLSNPKLLQSGGYILSIASRSNWVQDNLSLNS